MMLLSEVRRRVELLRLSPTARRVRKERLTYLAPEKLWRLERYLSRAMASTPTGDILEFGVALGGSGVVLARHAAAARRRFAGFDVFAMIPPPTSEKDDAKSKERFEIIASGKSKGLGGDEYYGYRDNLYETVTRTFHRYGVDVDGEGTQLVRGLFEETWPTFKTESIAFAHVDCDWYDPVKYCLDAISEKMVRGGVILLDDYNDYGGARVATEEFLAGHPEYTIEHGLNVALLRTAH